MSTATLPESYCPPRVVNGRVQTCRLLQIGCAYTPPAPEPSHDAERVQAALLEKPAAAPARWLDGHRWIVPSCLVAGLALIPILRLH
ncbi:hypothetical protein [Variovorax sp. PMC12]|uniref:hypothetical protein n=1 Tax=Variovorax sp. PMC12 TaxID=2126319 RepID=UPI000D122F74|nr:hypothetical protein [Variovorax sp. PMC12]AVQ84262.1 hypothetical protein C4F17_26765 [Variovorax sp. PMC12]